MTSYVLIITLSLMAGQLRGRLLGSNHSLHIPKLLLTQTARTKESASKDQEHTEASMLQTHRTWNILQHGAPVHHYNRPPGDGASNRKQYMI